MCDPEFRRVPNLRKGDTAEVVRVMQANKNALMNFTRAF